MKNLLLSILTVTLVLSPIFGYAEVVNASALNHTEIVKDTSKNNMINDVKQYIELKEDGTLFLENVPEKVYQKYNLEKLEKHLETLALH